ncbi:MAG: double zinc ribbon domain-containing protein [Planctomycetota bacterium]
MKLGMLAAQAAGRVADLLMPRQCAACDRPIEYEAGDLCVECWRDLATVVGGPCCRTCGDDRVEYLLKDRQCTRCRLKQHGLRFHGFARVGRYDAALKSLVLRFKHRVVLDRLLGRLLADAVRGQFDPGEVDMWVPVPAHWRRRLAVGYQPTHLLSRAAAAAWHGRVEPALVAGRYVPPFHLQPGLSSHARTQAIRGAFRAAKGYRLEGKTVCVVDDVTTTGATLAEARRALIKGGVARLFAAVVAKVSPDPPGTEGLDLRQLPDYTPETPAE